MRNLIICFVAFTVLIASWVLGQSTEKGQVDAEALFEQKCSICHSTDRPKSQQKTASEWTTTVEKMRGKGASLTNEETTAIVDYLSQHYGK